MHPPFAYQRPDSVEDAARRLARGDAAPLGGGTDLLVQIEEGLARPAAVVDLRALPEVRAITELPDGGLRVGAGARVQELAEHPLVVARWPALAEACALVGTPALRHMGTIGGNLCQRPRCWYFRRGIPCLKNGGDACPARAAEGENQYLAILDGGPCYVVHPSDPAVALTALEARVELARERDGALVTRTIPIAELYVLPRERIDRETVLAPGEWVRAIELPAASAAARAGDQRYHKLMQRQAWDFALVSLAAVRRADGDVRLVLGGVAPRPWRVNTSVEEDVASGGLDEDTIATLAERALYDAAPLSKNAYKVRLAAALLRRAIRALAAGG